MCTRVWRGMHGAYTRCRGTLLAGEEAIPIRGVFHVERVECRKPAVVSGPVVAAVALIRSHLRRTYRGSETHTSMRRVGRPG